MLDFKMAGLTRDPLTDELEFNEEPVYKMADFFGIQITTPDDTARNKVNAHGPRTHPAASRRAMRCSPENVEGLRNPPHEPTRSHSKP